MRCRRLSHYQVLLCIVVTGVLTSCGSIVIPFSDSGPGGGTSPGNTGHLAVADWANGRVLIYDAPFSTDQNASIVLGEPDFIHRTGFVTRQVAANTIGAPTDLALDTAGNLWVADFGYCRVLEFRPPFSSGMAANLVIGRPDFTATTPGCDMDPDSVTSETDTPTSVAFDLNGDLWVSDNNGNRVTEYRPPFQSGMKAALVIGEPDLTTTGCIEDSTPENARTLCNPYGITFDSRGNLWVADEANSRVLEFAPPFSTGMAANLELGQDPANGFTPFSRYCPTNSSIAVCNPTAVRFDTSGDLWVAAANGILEFTAPFSSGMTPLLVIPAQRTSGTPPSGAAVHDPRGIAFDTSGDLIVGDDEDNRVIFFPAPVVPGIPASIILGQPNLTSGSANQGGGPAAYTLMAPWGILDYKQ